MIGHSTNNGIGNLIMAGSNRLRYSPNLHSGELNRPLTLPRQAWFAVFGIALLIAFGWVALRSGPRAPANSSETRNLKRKVT
jgi:hypothetical protein